MTALKTLALACLMAAGAAHASGGYEPEDLFFSTARPDQPVREFVEHPAGYYIDNLVPYQVLWYWRLHGQALSPEAVKTFTALLAQLPQEDAGMDEADSHWSDWRKARAEAYAKLGRPLPAAAATAQPAQQFDPERLQASGTNCLYGDAFRNAAQTLSQRLQRATRDKADAPFVLNWLQAQDAVFDTCNDKAATKMPALPAHAPAWLKADNAYQRAAQSFYAAELAQADTAFEAIAADPSSEWRDLAAYMRLRVLARQHPGTESQETDYSKIDKETPEQLKQQAELTKAVDAIAPALLKNPRLQPLYPSIHRLAEALRIRYLLPETRLQRMGDALKTMGQPDVAAARLLLLNHAFRFCAYGDCKVTGPDNRSDLIAWISTVRDFGGHGTEDKWREKTSWSRYQRTHDLTWLLAAASLVPAAANADDARENELQTALAAVPEDSPARFAATQLRAQRLYAQGRFKEAREVIAGAAASPLIAHSPSGQNLVKALLLPTAPSEEEWRRLALRPVVARRDPEAMSAKPTAKDAKPLATAFDDDVIRFLNTRAPLPMWLRLSADPGLSPALRDSLLETAWTRAVLAGDYASARRAAELRNASTPAPAKGVDPIAGLRGSVSMKDDAAAWQHLMLERMASATETLSPPMWPAPGYDVIRSPLLPGRDSPLPVSDYSGVNYTKWCRALGVETTGPKAASAAEFVQPDWLPAAERTAQTALVAKLGQLPPDSIYFTQQSLALMARDRADPLVPQALSISVKMARYTCASKAVGEWSRKGLQTLRASYANSSWAAGTQYWFSGR